MTTSTQVMLQFKDSVFSEILLWFKIIEDWTFIIPQETNMMMIWRYKWDNHLAILKMATIC